MQLSPLTHYLTDQLNYGMRLIPKIASEGRKDDLHQFRVAIRRVRSLLKLYVGNPAVFSPMLKKFVKQTNAIRELDVLLSSIKAKRYPKTFKKLSTLRNTYYRSVFTHPFGQEILSELNRYTAELSYLNPDIQSHTVHTLTEEHYQKCVHDYREHSKHMSQKELHRLRIEFKIARYSLEFADTISIADKKEKIDACKMYQDFLGSLQDTFNQIAWLKQFYKDYGIKEVKALIRKRKKKLKKLKRLEVPVNRRHSPLS